MKARAIILTHIQKPMTLFGVQTPMLIATIGASLFGFLFFILIGVIGVSFIAFLAVLVAGYLVSYRLNKKDHHFITVYRTSKAFWKGKKQRILIRGKRK